MSKERYQLIKRCFPGIELRELDGALHRSYCEFQMFVNADSLERELEKAVRVYAVHGGLKTLHYVEPVDATHTALLIGIEPIQKDTAESLLRELVHEYASGDNGFKSIYDRAKLLLEENK